MAEKNEDYERGYRDGLKAAASSVAPYSVKEGEKVVGFAYCMWCRKEMPLVKRKRGMSDGWLETVCAGCNASYR